MSYVINIMIFVWTVLFVFNPICYAGIKVSIVRVKYNAGNDGFEQEGEEGVRLTLITSGMRNIALDQIITNWEQYLNSVFVLQSLEVYADVIARCTPSDISTAIDMVDEAESFGKSHNCLKGQGLAIRVNSPSNQDYEYVGYLLAEREEKKPEIVTSTNVLDEKKIEIATSIKVFVPNQNNINKAGCVCTCVIL